MKYYITEKRINEYINHHLKYSFANKKDFVKDINKSISDLSDNDKKQLQFFNAVKNKLNHERL